MNIIHNNYIDTSVYALQRRQKEKRSEKERSEKVEKIAATTKAKVKSTTVSLKHCVNL